MIPAVVPPELVAGGVAVVLGLSLAGWGWQARKREGALRAWLEQEAKEQKGRERFDAEMAKSNGNLGRRLRKRVRDKT